MGSAASRKNIWLTGPGPPRRRRSKPASRKTTWAAGPGLPEDAARSRASVRADFDLTPSREFLSGLANASGTRAGNQRSRRHGFKLTPIAALRGSPAPATQVFFLAAGHSPVARVARPSDLCEPLGSLQKGSS